MIREVLLSDSEDDGFHVGWSDTGEVQNRLDRGSRNPEDHVLLNQLYVIDGS